MPGQPDRPAAARRLGAALLALVAAGCVTTPDVAPALRFRQPIVLLGEVHDNAAQHALRLAAFDAALAAGARPALALEQIDREQQATIDRLRQRAPPPDADALLAAIGAKPGGGWNWDFYRPFIALALQHGLTIVAANVSRSDARIVMRDGLAAAGFDAEVPEPILHSLSAEIEDQHCGMLDAATAGRMALAQVARDQFMARVIERQAQAGGSVVLLAGNGHVRTDVGAPHWLKPGTRARSEAIGVLEVGGDEGLYDRRVFTAAQARSDPCAAMRSAPRPPG